MPLSDKEIEDILSGAVNGDDGDLPPFLDVAPAPPMSRKERLFSEQDTPVDTEDVERAAQDLAVAKKRHDEQFRSDRMTTEEMFENMNANISRGQSIGPEGNRALDMKSAPLGDLGKEAEMKARGIADELGEVGFIEATKYMLTDVNERPKEKKDKDTKHAWMSEFQAGDPFYAAMSIFPDKKLEDWGIKKDVDDSLKDTKSFIAGLMSDDDLSEVRGGLDAWKSAGAVALRTAASGMGTESRGLSGLVVGPAFEKIGLDEAAARAYATDPRERMSEFAKTMREGTPDDIRKGAAELSYYDLKGIVPAMVNPPSAALLESAFKSDPDIVGDEVFGPIFRMLADGDTEAAQVELERIPIGYFLDDPKFDAQMEAMFGPDPETAALDATVSAGRLVNLMRERTMGDQADKVGELFNAVMESEDDGVVRESNIGKLMSMFGIVPGMVVEADVRLPLASLINLVSQDADDSILEATRSAEAGAEASSGMTMSQLLDLAGELRVPTPRGIEMMVSSDAFTPIRDQFGLNPHRRFDADVGYWTRVAAGYGARYQTMQSYTDVLVNTGVVDKGSYAEDAIDALAVAADFLIPFEKPVYGAVSGTARGARRAYGTYKYIPGTRSERAVASVKASMPNLNPKASAREFAADAYAASTMRAAGSGMLDDMVTPELEAKIVEVLDSAGLSGREVYDDFKRVSSGAKDSFVTTPAEVKAVREADGYQEFISRVDAKVRGEGMSGAQAAHVRSAYEMAAALARESGANPWSVIDTINPDSARSVAKVIQSGTARSVARDFTGLMDTFLDAEDKGRLIRSFDHIEENGVPTLTKEGLDALESSVEHYLKTGAPSSVFVRMATDDVMEGIGGSYRSAKELGADAALAGPAKAAMEKWFFPFKENWITRFDQMRESSHTWKAGSRSGGRSPEQLKEGAKKLAKIDTRKDAVSRVFDNVFDEAGEITSVDAVTAAMRHIGSELLAPYFKEDMARLTERTIVPKKQAKSIEKSAAAKILSRIGIKEWDELKRVGTAFDLSPDQARRLKGLVMELGVTSHGKYLDRKFFRDYNFEQLTLSDMRQIRDVVVDSVSPAGSRISLESRRGGPSAMRVLASVGREVVQSSRFKNHFDALESRLASTFSTKTPMERAVSPEISSELKRLSGSINAVRTRMRRIASLVDKKLSPDEWLAEYAAVASDAMTASIPVSRVYAALGADLSPTNINAQSMAKVRMALDGGSSPALLSAIMHLDDIADKVDNFSGQGDAIQTVLSSLSDTEKFRFQNSLNLVESRLKRQKVEIRHEASVIAKSLGVSDAGGLPHKVAANLYTSFYEGNFSRMFDTLDEAGIQYDIDRGYGVITAITQVQVSKEISKTIDALYRASASVDDMASEAAASGRTVGRFSSDVKLYIKQILEGDIFDLEGVRTPGPGGLDIDFPGVAPIGGKLHNVAAYDRALKIVRDMGYQFDPVAKKQMFGDKYDFERGPQGRQAGFETYSFGDGSQAIIPQEVARYLDDMQKKAITERDVVDSGKTVSATAFGGAATEPKKGTTGYAIKQIMKYFPGTATHIKVGLTSGLFLPHPRYLFSVNYGNVMQMAMSMGPIETMKTMFTTVKHARMSAHVASYVTSNGKYAPLDGGYLVADNGKIYSASEISDMSVKYGLKTSMVDAEFARSFRDDIVNNFGTGPIAKLSKAVSGWQDLLIEIPTAMDTMFRTGIFIDGLKRGEIPEVAVKRAMDATFDYGDLTPYERNVLRKFIIFYSFQRKNTDLFMRTLIDNPERIAQQGRFYQSAQQWVLQEDPEEVLPEYYRMRLPFRLNKESVSAAYGPNGMVSFAPPGGPADTLYMMTDAYQMITGQGVALDPGRNASDAAVGFTSKIMPLHIPSGTAAADIGAAAFGAVATGLRLEAGHTPLGRKTEYEAVVPSYLVDWDAAMGGWMREYFDIVPQVENYPGALESPNDVTVFVAKNEKDWFLFKNLIQLPPIGSRYQSEFVAMDAANVFDGITDLIGAERMPDLGYVEPDPGLGNPGEFSAGTLMSALLGPAYAVPTPELQGRKLMRKRVRELEKSKKSVEIELDELPE